MKKKIMGLFLLSALSLTSLIVSCSQGALPSDENKQDNEDDSSKDDNLPLYEARESREIEVKELPTLEVGDSINLDDYITVIPGDNETKEEKEDLSYTVEELESSDDAVVDRQATYTSESNEFVAISEGVAGFLIKSHAATKTVFVNVGTSTQANEIASFFEGKDFSSYTLTKNYELDKEFNSVKKEDTTPYFYKTSNYLYNAESKAGYVANGTTVYEFELDSIDDKTSFLPMFYEDSADVLTTAAYNNSFKDLAEIFQAQNLTYNQKIEELFGENYAFGISSSSSYFTYLLNDIGLSNSIDLYGYSATITFIAPVIEEDALNLYLYATSTTNKIDVLLGPISFSAVDETSIPLLDEVNASTSFAPSVLDKATYSSLANLTSYTSKVTGKYVYANGEPYKATELFESYLPGNVDLTLKVTPNALEFSNFSLLEKGENGKVKLALDSEDNTYHKYTFDETSKAYADKGAYLVNGATFNNYKKVDTLSNYDPSTMFVSSLFDKSYFYSPSEGKYVGATYYNASLSSLFERFVSFSSAAKLVASDGPLVFYINSTTISLEISATSIKGEALTRMIDSDDTFYYDYSFEISGFNTTTID